MAIINGTSGDDDLLGTAGDDTINGLAGNDYLYGEGGNDTLDGGDGSDYLEGGAGNDSLNGGNADDLIYGGIGDNIDGGAGDDSASIDLSSLTAAINATLSPTASNTLNGATIIGIERLELSTGSGNDRINASAFIDSVSLSSNNGNDTLIGGAGNDALNGGNGSDTINGGDGDDTIYGNSYFSDDSSRDNLNGGNGDDTIYGSDGNDLINGDNGNDLIDGSNGDDTLNGGSGNDFIEGGLGNDVLNGGLGADDMTGGSGNDLYYVDNVGDVVVETSTLATEFDRVASTISYTLGANVEELYLQGSAAINGTGNGLNNTLYGNSANNVLNGGLGRDTMNGGLGNDLYYVNSIADVVVETSTLATEFDRVASTVNYTLRANVEALYLQGTAAINGTGNSLNNNIVGNSANNVLNGSLGADNMNGSLGNDLYYVDNLGDVVVETSTLATEFDRVASTVSYTLGANVEALYLQGTAAINGTGNGLNNAIVGNSADNVLNGGLGNDLLVGGGGSDKFLFGSRLNGRDTIQDLAIGSDILQISASGFGGGLVAGALSASQILIGSGATAANTDAQRFIYNTANGALYFDADGSGTGFGTVQFATLSNKANIDSTNFSIIA